MSQQKSNIKDAIVARTYNSIFYFHLEQSLEVEVLTATLSRRRMMHHGTVVAGSD